MSRTRSSRHALSFAAVTAGAVAITLGFGPSGKLRAETVNKNAFTNSTGQAATDFHLFVRGTLKEDPKSPEFTTASGEGSNEGNFKNGNVANGASANVSFHDNSNLSDPVGYFTPAGSPNHKIHSIDPNGQIVTFNPAPGGYDVTVVAYNNVGTTLTGSLDIYINNGYSANFNESNFETLTNATLLYSNPSFSLAQGQTLTTQTTFIGTDQYILFTGSADDGDGSGSHPFATALYPTVPEPSGLLLLATGIALSLTRIRIRE